MADINKVVNLKVESDIDKATKDVKKLNKGLKNTSEASSEMKSELALCYRVHMRFGASVRPH